MRKCTLFLLLVLIVAISVSFFTANAAAETTLNSIDNASISEKFADGTTMAVCPKCGGEPVAWSSFNTITSGNELTDGGHYYLTDTYKQYLSVSGAKEVCIHLNGYDWNQTAKSRALYMSGTAACTINIMGEGTVCGSDGYTDRTTRGATIEVNGSGCVLNLLGGTYTKNITTSVSSGSMEISGPTVALFTGGGTINMYGGATITGENTAGNTVRVPTGTFHMYGGTITGGTGAQGGNVLVTYNGTKAAGTFIMEDGLISNGTAAGYGGNIRVDGGGTAGDEDAPKAVFEMLGGTISGGSAKSNGGNVYATTNSVVTICGTVKDNISAAIGGNIAAAGQAQVTLRNATISGGVADSKGQNIHQAGGADFTIEGNVQVIDGNWWNTQVQCVIKVADDFSGVAELYFEGAQLVAPVYGTALNAVKCEGAFAGKLYLDGDYDRPEIYGMEDGKLYVSSVAVTDGESYTWFKDTVSAVEACSESSYVKLPVAQDVVLTKDCTIDLCGNTVNVSGAYTLYGMDSTGDDYSVPAGKAILSEETNLASFASVAGKNYVAANADGGVAFYRLGNQISGVALRPSADGIYYTGNFGCNEAVAGYVASYGVAVSLVNEPGVDFMADEDTLYTNFAGADIQGGTNATGALISGIMKQENNAQLNSAYGQMPIFAAAYLQMQDGTVIISDSVAFSLQTVMEAVDDMIVNDPLNYRKLTNPMRAFYEKWEDNGMADWSFKKIATPEEDDVIDVLMIGNSFCYYYVEELAGIAAAAGVKMRVCNVYYSGCKLDKHYNWWVAGEAPYEFFDTTFEGGRKKTENVSLEWCLAQGEWDYISLQTIESSGVSGDPTEAVENNKLYLDTFISYLREQFPKAQMVWHQTWSYAVGTATNGIVTTPESQVAIHEKNSKIAEIISETYDMININSGDAWKIIRDSGYDKLCARIGKGTNHEGDYYHDGDIGGGQYLNACVWYEIITGNSVVGNSYRPVYTYNGEEIPLNSEITYEMLQEAAHAAVAAYHSK